MHEITIFRVNMKEGLVKVSVIIPWFNGADTIASQLEVLAKQFWSEP